MQYTLVHHDTPVLIQFFLRHRHGDGAGRLVCRRLLFLHGQAIRDRFIASGKWFNRITGAALVAFGFRLALSRAVD
ncbi:hypothetical protein FHT70_004762 [Rhizobium sp. BK049]|nr:hypothetical protein [Rhizobium sp. BK049]